MTVARAVRAGLGTLRVSNAQAQVEVCPARGALVTSFIAFAEERLFLDEATFADPSKNVRGGAPILFPLAGPAPVGSVMRQHGFARNARWAELETREHRVVLGLRSTDETRALWPYDFELRYSVALEQTTLRLTWQVRNRGDEPWPLQLGVHPYFQVPLAQKSQARVETDATRAYDNQAKAFIEVRAPLRFDGDELDVHLLNHTALNTVLHVSDGASLRLAWSASFHTLVTWTLPGQPFICIEPWSSPSLPARGGASLPVLNAGETATFELVVEPIR